MALSENMNYLLEKTLPESIFRLVEGKSYVPDHTGMSGSRIMIFEDSVLKIVPCSIESEDTVSMMKWLERKIPVPRVIAYERDDEYRYLLMSKITGQMSCDEYFLEHPKELLNILAKALKMLWNVDISDCPRIRNLDTELEEAKYRVDNNLVDVDNVEPKGVLKIREHYLNGYMQTNLITILFYLMVTFAFRISSLMMGRLVGL